MTEDDMDFTVNLLPTMEQVRYVWDSMEKPSSRKVAAWFERKGGLIAHETVCKYRKGNWEPLKTKLNKKSPQRRGPKTKISKGQIQGTGAPRTGESEDASDGKPLDHRGVLGKLTGEQMTALLVRIDELMRKPLAELDAMFRKRWVVMNIMLAEYGAMTASQIACTPKDTAAFMSSCTEAVGKITVTSDVAATQPLNGHSNGHANGHGDESGNAVVAYLRDHKLSS